MSIDYTIDILNLNLFKKCKTNFVASPLSVAIVDTSFRKLCSNISSSDEGYKFDLPHDNNFLSLSAYFATRQNIPDENQNEIKSIFTYKGKKYPSIDLHFGKTNNKFLAWMGVSLQKIFGEEIKIDLKSEKNSALLILAALSYDGKWKDLYETYNGGMDFNTLKGKKQHIPGIRSKYEISCSYYNDEFGIRYLSLPFSNNDKILFMAMPEKNKKAQCNRLGKSDDSIDYSTDDSYDYETDYHFSKSINKTQEKVQGNSSIPSASFNYEHNDDSDESNESIDYSSDDNSDNDDDDDDDDDYDNNLSFNDFKNIVLSSDKIKEVMKKLKPKNLVVTLPKFNIKSEISYEKQDLQDIPFQYKNLDSIKCVGYSHDIEVREFKSITCFNLDEKGATVKNLTSIICYDGVPQSISIDTPFIFIIYSDDSFIATGQFVEPC
nr:MAG: hypothetical protein [Metapenaeopsis lamellata majanivirus]